MKTLLAILASVAGLQAQSVLVVNTNTESPEQRAAREVIQSVQQTKQMLLVQLRTSNELLWKSKNPQAILDTLGAAKSQELFALNTNLLQFCGALLTQANDQAGLKELQDIVSLVPPYSTRADGTIKLDSTVDPLPVQPPVVFTYGNETLSGNQTH